MRRSLDVLHTTARRKVLRCDIGPRLPVVAGDVERAVVRAGPDDSLFERRFSDRVERAVELFAGDVAGDRLAANALTAGGMRGEIGRDLFPGHAFVACAMHVLRSVIEYVGVVWRRGHWRHSLKSVDEITGRIAIQRLRANPLILLLPRLEVHHAILTFARSVDDFRIPGMRHDRPGLAAGAGTPITLRRGFRLTRDDYRRVVLLRAVEFVRELIVD